MALDKPTSRTSIRPVRTPSRLSTETPACGGKTHLESPWMSVLTHGLRWVVSREGRIVETVRSSQT